MVDASAAAEKLLSSLVDALAAAAAKLLSSLVDASAAAAKLLSFLVDARGGGGAEDHRPDDNNDDGGDDDPPSDPDDDVDDASSSSSLSSVVDALAATTRDATVVDMEDARGGGSGGGNPPPPSRALLTLPHDSSCAVGAGLKLACRWASEQLVGDASSTSSSLSSLSREECCVPTDVETYASSLFDLGEYGRAAHSLQPPSTARIASTHASAIPPKDGGVRGSNGRNFFLFGDEWLSAVVDLVDASAAAAKLLSLVVVDASAAAAKTQQSNLVDGGVGVGVGSTSSSSSSSSSSREEWSSLEMP